MSKHNKRYVDRDSDTVKSLKELAKASNGKEEIKIIYPQKEDETLLCDVCKEMSGCSCRMHREKVVGALAKSGPYKKKIKILEAALAVAREGLNEARKPDNSTEQVVATTQAKIDEILSGKDKGAGK